MSHSDVLVMFEALEFRASSDYLSPGMERSQVLGNCISDYLILRKLSPFNAIRDFPSIRRNL
jgi:hypothetical protein